MLKMKTIIVRIVGTGLIVFVFGCSTAAPSPELLETAAIAYLTENSPAPSSTPIDLVSLLIVDGDLPAGFTGAQIRNSSPEEHSDIPERINEVYQGLALVDGRSIGGISIYVFESSEDASNAMNQITRDLGGAGTTPWPADVGDRAYAQISQKDTFSTAAELVAQQCNIVIEIRYVQKGPFEDVVIVSIPAIIAHAERLVARLSQISC